MDKNVKYIEALGNLLSTYRSDLFYIVYLQTKVDHWVGKSVETF